MKIAPLSGLVAASFTPFLPDGRVNLPRISDLAADLRRNDVAATFICGTTGEGCSMTTEERQQVAAAWAKAKPAGLRLIVHVGHNCLEDSVALGRHAAEVGADAFAMIAPSYLRPATVDDLVASCALVAASAPNLPFYYYHMPEATGVNFNMAEFLRVASGRIPNLGGIKFTYYDLKNYLEAVSFDPQRFPVLYGRDETLLAGLALGAKGAIGSTYNYAAPIYQRMMRAFAAGDMTEARRQQLLSVKMIDVIIRYGGLPAGKAAMKLIGLDCGGMRLPLRALDAAAEPRFKADMEAAGFFTAIAPESAGRAAAGLRAG